MAGGALEMRRLFGRPGVPSCFGTSTRAGTSTQFPRTRKRTSGQPETQRTFARKVAVPLEGRFRTRLPRMALLAVSPSPGARTWRPFSPEKAEEESIVLLL